MTAPAATARPTPGKPPARTDGFCVKAYQQGMQRLVAACDAELLDTSHREGKFKLDVPASFYDGLRVDSESLACTTPLLSGLLNTKQSVSHRRDRAAVARKRMSFAVGYQAALCCRFDRDSSRSCIPSLIKSTR